VKLNLFGATMLAIMMLFCTPATAQDWAKERLNKSPRHLEWVTLKAGKRDVKTFVAYPQVKGKATAIVLIHEIFGLTDWPREMADELAAAGYIVVAPDLLSGTAGGGGGSDAYADDDARRKAVSALPPDQVTSDLNAVVDYAAAIPSANGKVVVAGFCWGGGQSFRLATNNSKLKAAFVFYGPPPPVESMKNITAPVNGFYGENDNRITSTVGATKDAMDSAGKVYNTFVYPNAGHGFMRAGEAPDANAGDKAARENALKEWMNAMGQL